MHTSLVIALSLLLGVNAVHAGPQPAYGEPSATCGDGATPVHVSVPSVISSISTRTASNSIATGSPQSFTARSSHRPSSFSTRMSSVLSNTPSASLTRSSIPSNPTSTTTPTWPRCQFLDPLYFWYIKDIGPAANPEEPWYHLTTTDNATFAVTAGVTLYNATVNFPSCLNLNDCRGIEHWYTSTSATFYQPMFVSPQGGPLRFYVDEAAGTAAGLSQVWARDWFCAVANVTNVARPIFHAIDNDAVQVPWQCDRELHLYAVGAPPPTGCVSVLIEATTIPAA